MNETQKLYKQFVNEVKEKGVISEAVTFHLETQTPFYDSLFRMGSKSYFKTINEGRKLYKKGKLKNIDEFDKDIFESDLGKVGTYKNKKVLLDFPIIKEEYINEDDSLEVKHLQLLRKAMTHMPGSPNQKKIIKQLNKVRKDLGLKPLKEAKYEGEDVELNKPKRGGSKKFFVYIKDPKTKNVKKVEFGAKDGGRDLAVKINDPEARKAFSARHNCSEKKDKTKPGYWSCRLPHFAKQLGLSGGGQFFW